MSRTLARADTRRRLLRHLAALPLAGALAALLGEEGEARRRRCRRRSRAKTCAGRCGVVKDNCKKKVDCGPDCPACQTCDVTSRRCVADPEQAGDCCGTPDAGTRCQSGACVAATAKVAECEGQCNGGSELICGQEANCPPCNDCRAAGCYGYSVVPGPRGETSYCLGHFSGFCTDGEACPDDTYCLFFGTSTGTCNPICTGN